MWTELRSTLDNMHIDHSWVFGVVSGFTLSIPDWVQHERWEAHHTVFVGVLCFVILADWIAGSMLASKAHNKTSTAWNDSLIRDCLIIGCCIMASGIDYSLQTGSLFFFILTLAFIHHNLYSFMANLALLGWEKYFPIGLIKWLSDEIEAKATKYFGADYRDEWKEHNRK